MYGDDVKVDVSIKMSGAKSTNPVRISKEHGIQVGSAIDSDTIMIVDMIANSATVQGEVAATFQFNLQANMHATMENFVVKAAFTETSIKDVLVLKDNVGFGYHDYDYLFNFISQYLVDQFNFGYKDGFDLKKLSTTLGFVAGLVRDTIFTPFTDDEFIFAGFSWISDM